MLLTQRVAIDVIIHIRIQVWAYDQRAKHYQDLGEFRTRANAMLYSAVLLRLLLSPVKRFANKFVPVQTQPNTSTDMSFLACIWLSPVICICPLLDLPWIIPSWCQLNAIPTNVEYCVFRHDRDSNMVYARLAYFAWHAFSPSSPASQLDFHQLHRITLHWAASHYGLSLLTYV